MHIYISTVKCHRKLLITPFWRQILQFNIGFCWCGFDPQTGSDRNQTLFLGTYETHFWNVQMVLYNTKCSSFFFTCRKPYRLLANSQVMTTIINVESNKAVNLTWDSSSIYRDKMEFLLYDCDHTYM